MQGQFLITYSFDAQTGVTEPTRAHAMRSDIDDVKKVTDILMKNKIMEPIRERKLTQFKNFNQNPLSGLDWPIWIDKKKLVNFEVCCWGRRSEPFRCNIIRYR